MGEMDRGVGIMQLYFAVSLLCTILGMRLFLSLLKNTNLLRKKESVESIKKPCIQELHKNKRNTFTMGGVVMNIVLLVMTAGYYLIKQELLWLNLFIILFGIMGFADDYIKIKKIRDGVKPGEKLIGLTVISILAVAYLVSTGHQTTEIFIPFINKSLHFSILPYSIILVLFLVASANSVNITDGLDGLALGIAIIALGFIGAAAWQLENTNVFHTALMLLGICLGTLAFNHYPAQIFMGDTGSLFLGGAIALLLIELNLPMWLLLILIVCLWETLTVIIQLASLKLRGKRVFLIAPYHHHLEKCGWKETQIVPLFWLVTLIFTAIGYLAFLNPKALAVLATL
jgi:phospho-N-acetylmuramoyl-pentapeptide-transferase